MDNRDDPSKLTEERFKLKEPLVDKEDDTPKLNITASKPMLCFVPRCQLGPISSDGEPFIIVVAGRGTIFAHMRCLGMDVGGDFAQGHYLTHIRGRLEAGLRDDIN